MLKKVAPTDPVEVIINGVKMIALPKHFKTGSVGWYLGGKADVDGSRCQLSLSIVVVGSKDGQPKMEVMSGDVAGQMTLEDVKGLAQEIDAGGGVIFVRDAKTPKKRK